MKIGTEFSIEGEIVKQDDRYTVLDNTFLKNLTVSMTSLARERSTTGHKHEGLEEVYIFTHGSGVMHIDAELIAVTEGDVVSVPAGAFHKVCAGSKGSLDFIAIFQKYDREKLTESKEA